MSDNATHAEVQELRAQLAAQQAEFAAFRARVEGSDRAEARPRRRPHRRLRGRFLPLALVALLVALMPLSLRAAGTFNDLTGGPHDANIGAIYNAGITTGCVPNVSYCPTDNVTRQEMASFLARTAGLGTNPPVANAKTAVSAQTATSAASANHAASADTATSAVNAQTATNATNAAHATSADTATTATNAGNAATIGGLAPSDLLRTAHGSTGANYVDFDNFTTMATLTITAPSAGFVMLIASGDARTAATSGCPCEAQLYVRHDNKSVALSNAAAVANASGGVVGDAAITTSNLFPVAAGSNSFTAQMRKAGGTAALSGYVTMTALFVPFGATGAVGASTEAPAQP